MSRYYLAAAAVWLCFTLQACQELANRDQFPPQQQQQANPYRFPAPSTYQPLPD